MKPRLIFHQAINVIIHLWFYFHLIRYHVTNVSTQAEEKSPIFLLHSFWMEVKLSN